MIRALFSVMLLSLTAMASGCCCSCCAPYDYCGPTCQGDCGGCGCHSVHRAGSVYGDMYYGDEMEMQDGEEVPKPMPYYDNGPDAAPKPPMPPARDSAQLRDYQRRAY